MSLRTLLRWTGSLIGAGGTALCITLVSQSARAVEKIGGNCASGGPYQIARPCPSGIPGAMTGGIFGGLVFLALFAFCVSDRGRPALMLAWSALFLTLGWDFLYYGLHPPGGGTSGGFLVCAVVFVIMGGIPLIWTVPNLIKNLLGDDNSTSNSPTSSLRLMAPSLMTTGAVTPTVTGTPTGWATPSPTVAASTAATAPRSGATGDVAAELEQLATLHARGELSDTEYDEAKRKTLDVPEEQLTMSTRIFLVTVHIAAILAGIYGGFQIFDALVK